MAAAAEAGATKNNWNMVISVVDDEGNLAFTERMDGAQIASIQTSQDEAHTALLVKGPTKDLQDAISKGNAAILKLDSVTPLQGSGPIIVVVGQVIGAIDDSGAMSAQDEPCAQAGLTALSENRRGCRTVPCWPCRENPVRTLGYLLFP
jgi:glc operon protein GlcG